MPGTLGEAGERWLAMGISTSQKEADASTYSGQPPWLHNDWTRQWGRTHKALLTGHRQTQTCSELWAQKTKITLQYIKLRERSRSNPATPFMQQAITQGGPQKLTAEGTNEQSRQKGPWGLVLTTDMFRLEKRSLLPETKCQGRALGTDTRAAATL